MKRGEEALSVLRRLSFPRVSGTPKEREAAALIREEIQKLGISVREEPFYIKRSFPVRAELSVLSPKEESYPVTGFIDGKPTGEEGVEAEFYYMEYVDENSLRRARNKFVLLNQSPDEETYQKLAEAGIAGFLLPNGSIRDTLENSDLDTLRFRDNWKRYGSVPAFAIRIGDALKLIKQRPEKVRFLLTGREVEVTSHNLMATVEGRDFPQEAIVIGAHYDSTEFSYGAWDNGAGVAQVLAALKYFAAHPPRRTIHFLFFGSEEVGLKGSRAFLEAHPRLGDSLLGMINIDGGGTYLGNDFIMVAGDEPALYYVEGCLKEAGHSAAIHQNILSSDSAVFADYGIPTIALARSTPRGGGYMHTRYDSIELISAQVLEEEIRFLIYLAGRLAESEIFPISRVIPENLRQKIIQYFGKGLSRTEAKKEE